MDAFHLMRPTRRLLLGIAALPPLMLGCLFFAWYLQARSLAEVLVVDIAATLARRLEHSPKPESPKFVEG